MTNPDVLAGRLLQRAHNRDGLPEILVGMLFLAVAGIEYGWSVLPHSSFMFKATTLLFAFGFPAACLLLSRWVKWLRRRYLVEREGYVEHLPRGHRPVWVMGAAAGVAMAALLTLLAFRHIPDSWVIGFTGVAGGFLAAAAGRQPRFYLAGVVMAATSLALVLAMVPMETAFAVLFGITGTLEVVLGGITLLRFLSETRGAGSDER